FADAGIGWSTLRGSGERFHQELGIALAIAAQPFDLAQLIGTMLESGRAIEQVLRPASLAELAVRHDVDADFGLSTEHVLRRLRQHLVVARTLAISERIDQRFRTNQSPNVSRQDPMLTAFH